MCPKSCGFFFILFTTFLTVFGFSDFNKIEFVLSDNSFNKEIKNIFPSSLVQSIKVKESSQGKGVNGDLRIKQTFFLCWS